MKRMCKLCLTQAIEICHEESVQTFCLTQAIEICHEESVQTLQGFAVTTFIHQLLYEFLSALSFCGATVFACVGINMLGVCCKKIYSFFTVW